jgi:hypothetical protein
MFEYLKPYSHIIVSGMQRSGTTIAARMIQYDLEIPYCYWVGNKLGIITDIPPEGGQGVYHAPGMSHLLHGFKSTEDATFAVIWMKRDIEEIIESAYKVKWDPTADIGNYPAFMNGIPDGTEVDYPTMVRRLAQEKINFWETQKPLVETYFEVEYESLRNHPLWLNDRPWKKWPRTTSPGTLPSEEVKILKGYSSDLDLKKPLSELLEEFPKDS